MSNRVLEQNSEATSFLVCLAFEAETVGADNWNAGGAFPDILNVLKKEGHICDRLYSAGARLVRDMQKVHGSSAGLTSKYGDQVDNGEGERLPSFRGDIDAFDRMTSVLNRLSAHERDVLRHCILSRELDRGSLSDWGRQHSAYQTVKTARAFAVGQIRSLLETLAQLYLMKIPWTN